MWVSVYIVSGTRITINYFFFHYKEVTKKQNINKMKNMNKNRFRRTKEEIEMGLTLEQQTEQIEK